MPLTVKGAEIEATFSVSDMVNLSDFEKEQIQEGNALSDMVQVFVTKADEKVRPSHAALHNTVWDANDPNAPVPPLDFGCRCKIEFRARNKTIASKTGLEPPPVNPPDPGDEALKEFWNEAEQSEDSNDPGGRVTPVDTFGESTGKEIEEGNVRSSDVFDKDTGDVRPASEVKDLANAEDQGRTKSSVFSAFAILEKLVVSPSSRQKIIRQATDLIKMNAGLKDEQALFDITMKQLPGLVGVPSSKQTRSNARRVARALLRSNGPLKR